MNVKISNKESTIIQATFQPEKRKKSLVPIVFGSINDSIQNQIKATYLKRVAWKLENMSDMVSCLCLKSVFKNSRHSFSSSQCLAKTSLPRALYSPAPDPGLSHTLEIQGREAEEMTQDESHQVNHGRNLGLWQGGLGSPG